MKPTAHLLALRVAGLACNGIAMLYLASALPDVAFGRFRFFVAVLVLTHFLFGAGFFISAARLGAFREGDRFRKLVGCILTLSVPLGAVYLGFLLVAALVANQSDKVYFEPTLLPAILFSPAILVHYGLSELCIGANRINLLGLLRCVPYGLNMLVILVLEVLGLLTYSRAALSYTASFFLTVLLVSVLLRPRFADIRQTLRDIRQHAKFGLDIYLARVIAVGVYKLDAPLIAFFLDFAECGYYALARDLVMPLTLVGQTFASTRYKSYARLPAIPKRHCRAIHALALAAALVPVFMGGGLMQLIYPNKPTVFFWMLQILGLRVFFQFAYPLYNMYLYARGHGRLLRYASLVSSSVNLAVYLVLIPLFGILGATWADVLVCAAFYFYLSFGYRRVCRLATTAPPDIPSPSEEGIEREDRADVDTRPLAA